MMPDNDVTLVREGYTISDENAAFGRIGGQYVMRDHGGHRIELPIATTEPAHLHEVWGAFKRAAAGDDPMQPMLFGEIVWSGHRRKSSSPAT
jgi:hypothetical protein